MENKQFIFSQQQNFQNLNDDENRIVTRDKANNFYKPRICTETFAYTAIDDWNSLPYNVKGIKSEDKFMDSLKKSLIEAARKADKSQFVYY